MIQMIEIKQTALYGCELNPEPLRVAANLLSQVCLVWLEEIREMVMKHAKETVRPGAMENREYAKWKSAMEDFRTRRYILTKPTLAELMILLVPNPSERRHGLDGLSEGGEGITARDLAIQLIKSGQTKPPPRVSPIVPRSRVPTMMSLVGATKAIIQLTPDEVVRVMTWCMMDHYRVAYIPQIRGTRLTVTSWRLVQGGGVRRRVEVEEALEVEPETEAADAVFENNRGVEWSIEGREYWPNQMWKIGEHRVALEETKGSGGEGAYAFMDKCTTWARDNYDPEEGLFPLAVLIAKMVSTMVPYIYSMPNAMKLATAAGVKSEAGYHLVMLESEWIMKKKGGGKTEGVIFVFWYVVLVSMMHPDSPLRKERLDQHKSMNDPKADGTTSWSQRACKRECLSVAVLS
jgi:hypothetical protein